MDETQFCYWLQGYVELSNASELSKEQVQIIKDHLKLVFEKKTPDRTVAPPVPVAPVTTEKQQVPYQPSLLDRTYCSPIDHPLFHPQTVLTC